MPSTAFRWTLPPRPPSPPSGPPKGTNFSLRKLTQPRPPLPACTLSLASSMNFMEARPVHEKGDSWSLPPYLQATASVSSHRLLFGDDVDVGVLFRASDAKFNNTVGSGE